MNFGQSSRRGPNATGAGQVRTLDRTSEPQEHFLVELDRLHWASGSLGLSRSITDDEGRVPATYSLSGSYAGPSWEGRGSTWRLGCAATEQALSRARAESGLSLDRDRRVLDISWDIAGHQPCMAQTGAHGTGTRYAIAVETVYAVYALLHWAEIAVDIDSI